MGLFKNGKDKDRTPAATVNALKSGSKELSEKINNFLEVYCKFWTKNYPHKALQLDTPDMPFPLVKKINGTGKTEPAKLDIENVIGSVASDVADELSRVAAEKDAISYAIEKGMQTAKSELAKAEKAKKLIEEMADRLNETDRDRGKRLAEVDTEKIKEKVVDVYISLKSGEHLIQKLIEAENAVESRGTDEVNAILHTNATYEKLKKEILIAEKGENFNGNAKAAEIRTEKQIPEGIQLAAKEEMQQQVATEKTPETQAASQAAETIPTTIRTDTPQQATVEKKFVDQQWIDHARDYYSSYDFAAWASFSMEEREKIEGMFKELEESKSMKMAIDLWKMIQVKWVSNTDVISDDKKDSVVERTEKAESIDDVKSIVRESVANYVSTYNFQLYEHAKSISDKALWEFMENDKLLKIKQKEADYSKDDALWDYFIELMHSANGVRYMLRKDIKEEEEIPAEVDLKETVAAPAEVQLRTAPEVQEEIIAPKTEPVEEIEPIIARHPMSQPRVPVPPISEPIEARPIRVYKAKPNGPPPLAAPF